MKRFVLAALFVAATAPAFAQPIMQDETRDRVLLMHQSRGTLAPGTRPKCFPSNVDDAVARAQFQCPWDPPNGQPRFPSARSFWGLAGRE
jgi:hypothetical protein